MAPSSQRAEGKAGKHADVNCDSAPIGCSHRQFKCLTRPVPVFLNTNSSPLGSYHVSEPLELLSDSPAPLPGDQRAPHSPAMSAGRFEFDDRRGTLANRE